MNKYRDWEVLEVLPIGWKVDNSCGSPLSGYDFCTDGKSVLNGGKSALAFFFLFFLHGISFGNGQQGISYNGCS